MIQVLGEVRVTVTSRRTSRNTYADLQMISTPRARLAVVARMVATGQLAVTDAAHAAAVADVHANGTAAGGCETGGKNVLAGRRLRCLNWKT